MPSRSWVIFKNWMKDCVLDTHLPDNHKKNGELKFPKYIAVCECGDMECNNLRRDQAGLYGKSNLSSSINYHDNSYHRFDEKDWGHEVYIKESEVLLKKGQINHLDWDDRKELRKLLD